MMSKEYITINGALGGVSATIKANYGRMGCANVTNEEGYKATFIMEKEIKLVNGTEDGLSRAVRATYGKTKTSAALCDYNSKPTLIMEKEKQLEEYQGWRIRKLSERECFRLMDVDDSDIDKIRAAKIPKTQQYKLAGNSIVCSCLYHIFRKLFIEQQNESRQLSLF